MSRMYLFLCLHFKISVLATGEDISVMPYVALGVTDRVVTQSAPRRRDGISQLVSVHFPYGSGFETAVGVGSFYTHHNVHGENLCMQCKCSVESIFSSPYIYIHAGRNKWLLCI